MNKLEPCAWILSGVLELRTCGMRLPSFNTADVKNMTEGCYAHVQCHCVLINALCDSVWCYVMFQDIALESMNRYVSPINPAVFPHLSIVLLGIGIFFMAWFFVYPLQQFAKEILFGGKNLENNLPQPPFKSSRFLGNCKLRLGSFSRIVPHFTVRCFEFHQC